MNEKTNRNNMPCRACRDKSNATFLGHMNHIVDRSIAPCHPCAIEHLRLAEDAHRSGNLYRAVWHLAQAATHAATHQQAEAIRNARIVLQRINEKVDFAQLRQLIGGTHAEH